MTKLGNGENPKLNIASSMKGRIRLKQINRIAFRIVSSKVKDILLEVYSPEAFTIGLNLVCNRINIMNLIMLNWIKLRVVNTRSRISTIKVKSEQPKGEKYQIKELRDYLRLKTAIGNRKIVVPISQYGLTRLVNTNSSGRILDYNIRNFSSAAGKSSTVITDDIRKISRLTSICAENPNITVKDNIYRLMYNPRLYEIAYSRLKSKLGNMTPGITPTTLDGLSLEVINNIISKLKSEQFQFLPGRRIHIYKKNGKLRPLTIASPRDKLVLEVMRMILEIIFEPTFSDFSHGFRPSRSCHSALRYIKTDFESAS